MLRRTGTRLARSRPPLSPLRSARRVGGRRRGSSCLRPGRSADGCGHRADAGLSASGWSICLRRLPPRPRCVRDRTLGDRTLARRLPGSPGSAQPRLLEALSRQCATRHSTRSRPRPWRWIQHLRASWAAPRFALQPERSRCRWYAPPCSGCCRRFADCAGRDRPANRVGNFRADSGRCSGQRSARCVGRCPDCRHCPMSPMTNAVRRLSGSHSDPCPRRNRSHCRSRCPPRSRARRGPRRAGPANVAGGADCACLGRRGGCRSWPLGSPGRCCWRAPRVTRSSWRDRCRSSSDRPPTRRPAIDPAAARRGWSRSA